MKRGANGLTAEEAERAIKRVAATTVVFMSSLCGINVAASAAYTAGAEQEIEEFIVKKLREANHL